MDFTGLPEPVQNPVYAYYPEFFQPQPAPLNDQDQNFDDNEPELQSPYLTPPSIKYRIAVVADLGKDARVEDGRFKTFLKEGNIFVQKRKDNPKKYNVRIYSLLQHTFTHTFTYNIHLNIQL